MELQPTYSTTTACPLCSASFSTKKVRSRFVKTLSYETDLKPVYEESSIDPTFYYAMVCPDCGYSFSEDFSPYFPPLSKEQLNERVTKEWKNQSFSEERTVTQAIHSLKLAAYCATIKKEKNSTIAGLYLRLSWLYRTLQDANQEIRFQRLALHFYEQAYQTGDYTGTKLTTERLLYLLGELSFRQSKQSEATRYFSQLLEKQSTSTDKRMIKLGRDRWHDIREIRHHAGASS